MEDNILHLEKRSWFPYHGAFTEEFVSTGDTDGTYRMGARHYSTVLGRFLQKEPLNLAGPPSAVYPLSANDYVYCGNSPTTATDITGLDSMNMGILYPPEKPGPSTPDEPLPDPDPYFDPNYKPGGQKPETIIPGVPSGFLSQFPWWDRRTPSIPSADGLSGGPLMGMSSGAVGPLPILPIRPLPILPMPAPADKLPPRIFPIKGDWLNGDALLPQGYKDNHFVVTKSISVSMSSGAGSGSGHFRMPNYGFVRMGPSYGSGKEQVQSKADFNKNFWKQEGMPIVEEVAKWTLRACELVLFTYGIVEGLGVMAAREAAAMAATRAELPEILRGMKLYRVFSGGGKFGESWTTVVPRTLGKGRYRKYAGLYPSNKATHIIEAILDDTTGVFARRALPYGKNPGGIIEVKIPNAEAKVIEIITRRWWWW